MRSWYLIAERRIEAAMERGEFDNLPGEGLPLNLEDDAHVPAEYRLIHRVLKNSGYVPEQVTIRKAIAVLEDKLAGVSGDDEPGKARRTQLGIQIACLRMRLEVER
ncbi:MAG: DnaJ family domain-containing protein [Pseudomonadota bacterium]